MNTSAAECAIEWGVGSLNIDGGRIQYRSQADRREETRGVHVGGAYEHAGSAFKKAINPVAPAHDAGRWPANIILQHSPECAEDCEVGCAVEDLGKQSGVSTSSGGEPFSGEVNRHGIYGSRIRPRTGQGVGKGDTGTAARFFKQVKP